MKITPGSHPKMEPKTSEKAKNARPIDVDFWKNERLAQKDQ